MKRMITKKMRDSFKVGFMDRVNYFQHVRNKFGSSKNVGTYFEETKKQRILILRRTIK